MRALLDRGAKADCGGGLAMFVAALGGHHEVMRLLLEHGVNRSDSHDIGLVLIAAVSAGHTEVVSVLLDHGAKHDCKEAIRVAVSGGHHDVVRLLLDHGMRDADGEVVDCPTCCESDVSNAYVPPCGHRLCLVCEDRLERKSPLPSCPICTSTSWSRCTMLRSK